MQGRRIEDEDYPTHPGDYAKHHVHNYDATIHWVQWLVMSPNESVFYLCNDHFRDRNGRFHQVDEHEDGTISVLPQPGNSNSVQAPLNRHGGWHGYIDHGEWKEC